MTNTELIQKSLDTLQAGLIAIQAKLGVATEHIWDILVRQSYVASFTNLVYYVIVVIFDIVLYRLWNKLAPKMEKGDVPELCMIGMVLSTILAVIVSVVAVASIRCTVTGFVNPEYQAVMRVVDMVQGDSNGKSEKAN